MKKRILVILLLSTFIIMLTGASSVESSRVQQAKAGLALAQELSGGTVVFDTTVSEADPVYAGAVKYSDDEYSYIVDPDEGFVESVLISDYYDPNNMVMTRSLVISFEEAEKLATDYFKKAMGKFLKYDIETKCNMQAGLGTDYIFEAREVKDGVETGTKGVITINRDGLILSASFIKGTGNVPSMETLISEDTAKNIAVQVAREDVGKNYEVKKIMESELKTFNESTYWKIALILSSQEQELYRVIEIDAHTKEILSIGKGV